MEKYKSDIAVNNLVKGREIPLTNEIGGYLHCEACSAELPKGVSPKDYARQQMGFTPLGVQLWCTRHEINIAHIDFQGQKVVVGQHSIGEMTKIMKGEKAKAKNTNKNVQPTKPKFVGTKLMTAVYEGHADAVTALINSGVNINENDSAGFSALMMAASCGHTEIVTTLIGKGAALDQKTNGGNTALTFAVRGGHADIVRVLIESGAPLNEKDSENWTDLMFAARNGFTDIVTMLSDNGALLNERDSTGWTALMMAATNGQTDTVDALISAGAQ